MSGWAFGRSLLSAFWTKWGPAIRMLARNYLHTVIALLLLAIQMMDSVTILVNGVIYVMDRSIDLMEDLLDFV